MKTSCILLILTVLLIQASSCQNDDTPVPAELSLITKGTVIASMLSQGDRTITNQNDWTTFVNGYNIVFKNDGSGEITETTIDFSRYQVMVVIDGLKGAIGYSVNIASVEEIDNQLIVEVEHVTPEQRDTNTVTQAYTIVKAPKSNLPVVFQHTCTAPWVYATLIAKGNQSGEENIPKQNQIITTQEDWIDLLNQMNSYQQRPNFLAYFPEIDFEKSIVVAVFDEVKGTCCNSIDITDVFESETGIEITIQNLWYGASAAIGQPLQISTIPKTSKPISFKIL